MANKTYNININSDQKEMLASAMTSLIRESEDLRGITSEAEIEEQKLLRDMLANAVSDDVINDFTL